MKQKQKITNPIFRIGIIGGGPKGLYGLERLVAQKSEDFKIEIHIFNRTSYMGSGDIYRDDQPLYLLMNYNNGFINMWKEESFTPVGAEALSFVEWLKNKNYSSFDNSPKGYAPRAVVGKYLQDGFKKLKDKCPENVSIHTHVGEVTDLIPKEDDYFLEMKNGNSYSQFSFPFQKILIATGHPKPSLSSYQNGLNLLAKKKIIPFVYPVDKMLKTISAGSQVGIKGIGLTFIDTVLALTEGRGGKFIAGKKDSFKYVPSGNEPLMFPFSRTGNPIIPREYCIKCVSYFFPRSEKE